MRLSCNTFRPSATSGHGCSRRPQVKGFHAAPPAGKDVFQLLFNSGVLPRAELLIREKTIEFRYVPSGCSRSCFETDLKIASCRLKLHLGHERLPPCGCWRRKRQWLDARSAEESGSSTRRFCAADMWAGTQSGGWLVSARLGGRCTATNISQSFERAWLGGGVEFQSGFHLTSQH